MSKDNIIEIRERAMLINKRTSSEQIRTMSSWIISKCDEELAKLQEIKP